MSRVAFIVLAILAVAGGVAYWFGVAGVAGPAFRVSDTLFDTDASGSADLVRRQIGQAVVLWRWDRDGDGQAEVVAYDTAIDDQGTPKTTGQVTAWDIGGDGVLEQGTVPAEVQALLRSPEFERALAAAGPGIVELVDITTREFVAGLVARYDDWRLSGFRMPIVGASLPDADRLLPGSPRPYRSGVHQGFDMYPGHVGVPTGYGGPVVAAKGGALIRVDRAYQEMTPEQYAEAIAASRSAGTTPARELDLLRGRQVWIDHGHGVVTRYAHLSAVQPGLSAGDTVEAGQILGFVGNSGMEDAARGSNNGAHLHFELRIDDHYLGEGLVAAEIRSLANRVFGLAE